jgi:hypothetical protein
MLKRKLATVTIAVTFALPVVIPFTAQATPNLDTALTTTASTIISSDEIYQKLSDIGNKYKVGDILSDEDANFVKIHSKVAATTQPNAISIQSTKTADFVGYYGNVVLSGNGSVNLGIVNNSVSGNIQVRDAKSASHTSIGSVVELRCYGAFGEGGTKIGLVYSKDYQNTSPNADYNRNDFSDKFFASVAYYSFEVRGLVDGSSFATTATVR